MMTRKKTEELFLDLDSLVLQKPRIVFGEGTETELRDFTTGDAVDMIGRMVDLRTVPASQHPLAFADAVVAFSADPEKARPLVEATSMIAVARIWDWIREMPEPVYEVTADVVGRVRVGEKECTVSCPSIAAYRIVLDVLEITTKGVAYKDPKGKLRYKPPTAEQLYEANLRTIAAVIPDLTPEELAVLPYQKRVRLESFVTDVINESLARFRGEQTTPRPTRGRTAG